MQTILQNFPFQGIAVTSRSGNGLMNILYKRRIFRTEAALYVGRGKMSYNHRMATAFRYDGFAHVSGSIEIEVRTVAYQYLRPVCLR